MLKTLRSLYAGLPVIRELNRIRTLLGRHLAVQRQALQKQMCDFEEQLLRNPRYSNPMNLCHYERQVFSQFGEDGIIAEIFRRIGARSKAFLEIGVGDGLENNTTFLLFQGWNGFWVEGNAKSICTIQQRLRKPIADGRLRVAQSFVTAENISETLSHLQVTADIDLLSLDIDRNTYWVWAALRQLRPRVVVVEYNGHIPAEMDWKVDYDARLSWNCTGYFGASLKAYELLGKEMGYSLVGCNMSGVNAFLVRDDLCGDKFEAPFTSEKHYEPFRQFLEGRRGHPPCFSDNP